MTASSVELSAARDSLKADILVLGAVSGAKGARLITDTGDPEVAAQLALFDFEAKPDEILRLPSRNPAFGSVAVIGLGAIASTDAVRAAAASAVRQLVGKKSVVIDLGLTDEVGTAAALLGATLGEYTFTTFFGTLKKDAKSPAAHITIVSSSSVDTAARERITVLADSVHMVKDLVNTPAAQLYPQSFADAAEKAAAGLPVKVEVWDEKKLLAENCGGILGVGQGSSRQPRLVKVTYAPAGATTHLCFVGKGITFDTGGYSIKPWDAMLTMHHDMAGAATLLAVTLAAARLGLKIQITAYLCVAENMVSGNAIRPNDVLTMRNGTTVEVLNTDAEGRLVMADGLSLASEDNPDAIIDVATLTGAAIVSLGRRTAAVMGDTALVAKVVAAGESEGEAHWPMPLPGELRTLLDSRFADLANLSPSVRDAGMLVAGVFLREFVGVAKGSGEKIPWAHLDIAGTGTNNGAGWGVVSTGGTASSVRTLIRAVEEMAAK